MSPQRVPMTSPFSGVMPMLVSMLLPRSTAVMLAPLPRWQVMSFRSLERLAEELGRGLRDELVRGAVEAVFPDAVLLVVLVGDRVEVGGRRHGVVEGRVEHGDVGHAREDALAGLDAAEVRRVVQRRQRGAFADDVLDLVGDHGRVVELLAAVHDAVADGLDLLEAVEHAEFGIDQLLANHPQRLVVVCDLRLFLEIASVEALVAQVGFAQPDALDDALGADLFFLHGEHGELERGTAGVDDQDVFRSDKIDIGHISTPFQLFSAKSACEQDKTIRE